MTKKDAYFSSAYRTLRSAIERAGISLPERQLSHVLWHTSACHLVMNSDNDLILNGHTDIKMAMCFADFSPDCFEDMVSVREDAK